MAILLLAPVLAHAGNPAPFGPTFGSGLAGVQICHGNTTLLNYTLSSGATHGVLHHFWTTGGQHQIDRIHVHYYIDGEKTPSISFQPALMCGQAFPELIDQKFLYHAGQLCGKSAPVGGWWNTFPIPFQKSVLVTAAPDPQDSAAGCIGGYTNIRGTENLPVTLPGGIPLSPTARLHLQKNTWATRNPRDFVNIVDMPAGTMGSVFMTSFAVSTKPVGGSGAGGGYIEGCWSFYPKHDTPYPGVVVGTGVEDYFDSAYYFGGDSPVRNGLPFQTDLSGLTYFARTKDGFERLSAYRFHTADPLAFVDGGRLVWRVGCGGPPPPTANDTHVEGTSKCGNELPPRPPVRPPHPPKPMADSGCSDGTCDAFCDVDTVRGCVAHWDGSKSMRAPRTGGKCGSGSKCDAPADACGEGWELCMANTAHGMTPSEFREAISPNKCNTADPRRFIAAMSHSEPQFSHLPPKPCPPAPVTDDNGCLGPGAWGCEPVCCGSQCVKPSCPDAIWPGQTHIHIGLSQGCCGKVSGGDADGVLCCKAQKTITQESKQLFEPEKYGRTLSPINITTYGWFYTF